MINLSSFIKDFVFITLYFSDPVWEYSDPTTMSFDVVQVGVLDGYICTFDIHLN